MQPREVAGVMRQIRGAPVTILMTMVMLANATGNEELCRCTGYDTGTVRKALNDLEFLGLVRRFRRYNGYVLTAEARQLPLVIHALPDEARQDGDDVIEANGAEAKSQNSAESECISRSDPEKISVGSSSLHDHDLSDQSSEKTTTTNQQTRARGDPEPEKIGLGADATQAVDVLCETGVPKRTRNGKGARDAVEAALAGGWSGTRVLREVRAWLDYCATDAGSSITTPGVLTACRIRERQPAPEQLPLSPEAQARSYIEQQYEQIVKR